MRLSASLRLSGLLGLVAVLRPRGGRAALSVMPHQSDGIIMQLRGSIMLDEQDLLGPLPPTACSSLDDGPFCSGFDWEGGQRGAPDGSGSRSRVWSRGSGDAHFVVDGVLSHRLQARNKAAFNWGPETFRSFSNLVSRVISESIGSPQDIVRNTASSVRASSSRSPSARSGSQCFQLAFGSLSPGEVSLPNNFSAGLPAAIAATWQGGWEVSADAPRRGASDLKAKAEDRAAEMPSWATRLVLQTAVGYLRFAQPVVLRRVLVGIPAWYAAAAVPEAGVPEEPPWGSGGFICGRRKGAEKWCTPLETVVASAHLAAVAAGMEEVQVLGMGPSHFRVLAPPSYPGVAIRKGMQLENRSGRMVRNSSIVRGVVEEGGEWLRIGEDKFLPIAVGETVVLEPIEASSWWAGSVYVDVGNSIHSVDEVAFVGVPQGELRVALVEVATTLPSHPLHGVSPEKRRVVLLKRRAGSALDAGGAQQVEPTLATVSRDATIWDVNEVLGMHMRLRDGSPAAGGGDDDASAEGGGGDGSAASSSAAAAAAAAAAVRRAAAWRRMEGDERMSLHSFQEMLKDLRWGRIGPPAGISEERLREEVELLVKATKELQDDDVLIHSKIESLLQQRLREKALDGLMALQAAWRRQRPHKKGQEGGQSGKDAAAAKTNATRASKTATVARQSKGREPASADGRAGAGAAAGGGGKPSPRQEGADEVGVAAAAQGEAWEELATEAMQQASEEFARKSAAAAKKRSKKHSGLKVDLDVEQGTVQLVLPQGLDALQELGKTISDVLSHQGDISKLAAQVRDFLGDGSAEGGGATDDDEQDEADAASAKREEELDARLKALDAEMAEDEGMAEEREEEALDGEEEGQALKGDSGKDEEGEVAALRRRRQLQAAGASKAASSSKAAGASKTAGASKAAAGSGAAEGRGSADDPQIEVLHNAIKAVKDAFKDLGADQADGQEPQIRFIKLDGMDGETGSLGAMMQAMLQAQGVMVQEPREDGGGQEDPMLAALLKAAGTAKAKAETDDADDAASGESSDEDDDKDVITL